MSMMSRAALIASTAFLTMSIPLRMALASSFAFFLINAFSAALLPETFRTNSSAFS